MAQEILVVHNLSVSLFTENSSQEDFWHLQEWDKNSSDDSYWIRLLKNVF